MFVVREIFLARGQWNEVFNPFFSLTLENPNRETKGKA